MQGRVAGAPISWGVCEVPGWGCQRPVGRVDAFGEGHAVLVLAVRESLSYLGGLFGGQQ